MRGTGPQKRQCEGIELDNIAWFILQHLLWPCDLEHVCYSATLSLALFFPSFFRKRIYLGSKTPDGDQHDLHHLRSHTCSLSPCPSSSSKVPLGPFAGNGSPSPITCHEVLMGRGLSVITKGSLGSALACPLGATHLGW